MNPMPDALTADRQFFTALIDGDGQALDRLLSDDFILIDVMSGSVIAKPEFLAAIRSGQVTFEAIEPADNLVRHYQGTAVITGRTQMKGRFGEAPFAFNSRYTHVFVAQQGEWRLVSAQGTQISAPPGVG
jgi:ketosteroid isomerase-like protein